MYVAENYIVDYESSWINRFLRLGESKWNSNFYNLKCDPIVSVEINKQCKIIKHETGGQLDLPGSGQPRDLGKEMHNSCYRLRLLLINWTAGQTIWWQQDLVLMSFQKGGTTLSYKEQLQWSPAS